MTQRPCPPSRLALHASLPALAALLLLLLSSARAQHVCEKDDVRVRREIRDLSDDERETFIDAIITLHRTPSTLGNFSQYEEFTYIHKLDPWSSHHDNRFFPWHRKIVYDFETRLRAINKSIAIPYWDWTRDAHHVHTAPVFTPQWFGGSGATADDDIQCVPDGRFSQAEGNFSLHFAPDFSTNVELSGPECLRRGIWLNGTGRDVILRFPSMREVEFVFQLEEYVPFRKVLEVFHWYPHVIVGGRGRGSWDRSGGELNSFASSNDPLFYVHHSFIDKLYHRWQQQHGHDNYSGNATLSPWGVPVAAVSNLTEMCVEYRESDITDAERDAHEAAYNASFPNPLHIPPTWRRVLGSAMVRRMEQEILAVQPHTVDGSNGPARQLLRGR
ncbi:unnamed protein product [Vitrella brassicaformis CCMP3155]|uniref:Tyrosinase copper-binding domain-containing protein n=1 Tax=Vitrella brassicaformis (strain CCMP3155) TaxID=1169540 RepID=A0A0G4GQD9_VITBC|nr:unnamed protein product [Vitrella brassicaformis CCMP3155]|eukprot:CEM32668.1 unnamed protein product [Vitrella brassicaformis CCMP3155]